VSNHWFEKDRKNESLPANQSQESRYTVSDSDYARQAHLDDEKVDRWAEQLIKGEAYLGQLSWNLPLANS